MTTLHHMSCVNCGSSRSIPSTTDLHTNRPWVCMACGYMQDYPVPPPRDLHKAVKALEDAVEANPRIIAYILRSVQVLCRELENNGFPASVSCHAKQIRQRIEIQQGKYL